MATLKELENALIKADDSGNTDDAKILAGEIRKRRKEKPKKKSFDKTTGAITSFGQGASFGFADELYGLTMAALPYPFGSAKGKDESFADLYKENVEGYRAKQKGFAEEHPGLSLGLEITGGGTTGIGGAGKLAGTKMLGPFKDMNRFLQYGLLGTGGGALAGAGYGEGLEGKAISSGIGAGLGGLLSVAAPPLISGIGKVANFAARPLINLIESRTAPDVVAAKKLAQIIERDQMTPDQVSANMERMGDDAVIADAAGENTLSALEAVANTPGKGQQQAIQQLRQRQLESGQRIEKIVSDEISGQKATVQMVDEMQAARKAKASPHYKSAYDSGNVRNDEIDGLLLRIPERAFKELEEISQIEGLVFPNIIQTSKDGARKIVSDYGVKDIDAIKKGLDRIIEQETNSVTGKVSSTGRRLIQLKNSILSKVDDQVPEYKVARGIYSDSISNENAMAMGRKFFNTDYDIIEKQLSGMSQSEKDFFKMGVARALQNQLRKKVNTGDKTKVFNKEAIIDRLRPVFDDEQALNRFLDKLDIEQRKSLTYTRATGNSRTAARQAAQKDLEGPGAIPRGGPTEIAFNALFEPNQKITEPVRSSLARMLMSNDPGEIQRAIRLIAAQKTARGPLLPEYVPYGGVAGLGNVGGLLAE